MRAAESGAAPPACPPAPSLTLLALLALVLPQQLLQRPASSAPLHSLGSTLGLSVTSTQYREMGKLRHSYSTTHPQTPPGGVPKDPTLRPRVDCLPPHLLFGCACALFGCRQLACCRTDLQAQGMPTAGLSLLGDIKRNTLRDMAPKRQSSHPPHTQSSLHGAGPAPPSAASSAPPPPRASA